MDFKTEEKASPSCKSEIEETKSEQDYSIKELTTRTKTPPIPLRKISPKKKRAQLFVRIRPLETERTHGEAQIPSDKYIADWDNKQVTMRYMSRV